MAKVNWAAKFEHEFISNFKLLQAGMVLMNIEKHVPVERLVKARLTDNLEFAQWFKTSLWDRYYKVSEAREAALAKALPTAAKGSAKPDFSFVDKCYRPDLVRVSLPMTKPNPNIDEAEASLGKRVDQPEGTGLSNDPKKHNLQKSSQIAQKFSEKKVLDGLSKAFDRCNFDGGELSTAPFSMNTLEEAEMSADDQGFEILSSTST